MTFHPQQQLVKEGGMWKEGKRFMLSCVYSDLLSSLLLENYTVFILVFLSNFKIDFMV